MPEDLRPATRPLTGDDIIAEVLRNCEAGVFKIRNTAILPCIYRIYLHAADHDAIRPVTAALIAETRSALAERLEQLNAKGKPLAVARYLGFDSSHRVSYRILDPDWTIEFLPDVENKLDQGDIEIYSELASAAKPEFEGAMTRNITRRLPVETASGNGWTAPTAPAASQAFGSIRYQDSGGEKQFSITRNQVVIGRGGKSFWVDIQLEAPADVSREHCRIRRDASTGRFYIKDVSQFGTSVDGKRIPSSQAGSNGGSTDPNLEFPLPSRAKITLADVITLEFESTDAR